MALYIIMPSIKQSIIRTGRSLIIMNNQAAASDFSNPPVEAASFRYC